MSGKRQSAAVSTDWGINAAICDLQRGVPSLCSIMQDPGPGREYSCDLYILSRYGHVAQDC